MNKYDELKENLEHPECPEEVLRKFANHGDGEVFIDALYNAYRSNYEMTYDGKNLRKEIQNDYWFEFMRENPIDLYKDYFKGEVEEDEELKSFNFKAYEDVLEI